MKKIIYIISVFAFAMSCSMDDEIVGDINNTSDKEYTCDFDGVRPSDAYTYPILPGTPAWAELKTGQEMTDACQIPVELLKKMSTQAVIQALLDHPLLLEIFQRFQFQADFESLFFGNNAYKELTGRKDAGKSLIDRLFIAQSPIKVDELRGYKSSEWILSQEVFLKQLNDKEKTVLMETVLKNDELQYGGYNQVFEVQPDGYYLRPVGWLLAGRTLLNVKYEPLVQKVEENSELNAFFNDKNFAYMAELHYEIGQTIMLYLKEYLKN